MTKYSQISCLAFICSVQDSVFRLNFKTQIMITDNNFAQYNFAAVLWNFYSFFHRNGQYGAAYSSALKAGALQDQLEYADFTIDGVTASYSFRLLVPLGYQFKADTYWALLNNEEASSQLQESLNKDTVIEAYRVAVDTAPLNCSRMFNLAHHA